MGGVDIIGPHVGDSRQEDHPLNHLAAELRTLHEKTGKSLKELERDTHSSDSSLSRYLSGRATPPWSVVECLARTAGTDPLPLRGLWEEASRQRRRTAPAAARAASGTNDVPHSADSVDGADAAGSVDSAAGPDGAAGARRRLRPAAVLPLALAAMVGCGGGVVIGMQLASRPAAAPAPPRSPIVAAVSTQNDTCATWPWPASAGRAVEAPTHPHGDDHLPMVALVTGRLGSGVAVWAALSQARYGDRVWLDASSNGGLTWAQCGPYLATGTTAVTPGHPVDPRWRFRACADTPRPALQFPRDACTTWW